MGKNERPQKGMYECKVCHVAFPLLPGRHYIAREPYLYGLYSRLRGGEPAIWDAWDCPWCRSQNLVNERKHYSMETTGMQAREAEE